MDPVIIAPFQSHTIYPITILVFCAKVITIGHPGLLFDILIIKGSWVAIEYGHKRYRLPARVFVGPLIPLSATDLLGANRFFLFIEHPDINHIKKKFLLQKSFEII